MKSTLLGLNRNSGIGLMIDSFVRSMVYGTYRVAATVMNSRDGVWTESPNESTEKNDARTQASPVNNSNTIIPFLFLFQKTMLFYMKKIQKSIKKMQDKELPPP